LNQQPLFLNVKFYSVDILMASLPATFESDDEFAVYLQQLERENEQARQELRAVRAEAGILFLSTVFLLLHS
jgi:hypothetical protein